MDLRTLRHPSDDVPLASVLLEHPVPHVRSSARGLFRTMDMVLQAVTQLKERIREDIPVRAHLAAQGAPLVPEEERAEAIQDAIRHCPLHSAKATRLRRLGSSDDVEQEQVRAMIDAARQLSDLRFNDPHARRRLSSAFEKEIRRSPGWQEQIVTVVESVVEAAQLVRRQDRNMEVDDPQARASCTELAKELGRVREELTAQPNLLAALDSVFNRANGCRHSRAALEHDLSISQGAQRYAEYKVLRLLRQRLRAF